MIAKLSIGLVLLAALAAGTVGWSSSTDPAAKTGCCSKAAACTSNEECCQDCCDGCPDCSCEKDCCADCTDGCDCPCESQQAAAAGEVTVE